MYAYDDMLKAQRKVMAMQKKQMKEDKYMEERGKYVKPVQDIGTIFYDFNNLENDINMTKRDLDEYLSFTGDSARNIPSLHNISPLSRKILSALKQIDFKNVPENQLRDLKKSSLKNDEAWTTLRTSVRIIRDKRRPKDKPFMYLYAIAKEDYVNLLQYIQDHLKNVGGHDVFLGSGIPKRFL
jgi:hypothetical protein